MICQERLDIRGSASREFLSQLLDEIGQQVIGPAFACAYSDRSSPPDASCRSTPDTTARMLPMSRSLKSPPDRN